MRNLFKPLLVALILVGLMSSCVSKKKFSELEEEKNALATELEQTRNDLQAQITQLQQQNSSLAEDKNQMSGELSNVKNQLNTTQTKLSAVEESVDDKQNQIDDLRGEITAAFSDVENVVTQSNQRIEEMENMLYLDLEDDVNFRTASDNVNPEDNETITQIADMLKGNPNLTLVVEGHADKRPIRTGKYRDNWDLSVSRSTQVIRKLLDKGVNPEQLIASGRAEFMPSVTENPESSETLSANRRTEFILVPNIGKLYQIFKSQKP